MLILFHQKPQYEEDRKFRLSAYIYSLSLTHIHTYTHTHIYIYIYIYSGLEIEKRAVGIRDVDHVAPSTPKICH
jgi:hypothetical protein